MLIPRFVMRQPKRGNKLGLKASDEGPGPKEKDEDYCVRIQDLEMCPASANSAVTGGNRNRHAARRDGEPAHILTFTHVHTHTRTDNRHRHAHTHTHTHVNIHAHLHNSHTYSDGRTEGKGGTEGERDLLLLLAACKSASGATERNAQTRKPLDIWINVSIYVLIAISCTYPAAIYFDARSN